MRKDQPHGRPRRRPIELLRPPTTAPPEARAVVRVTHPLGLHARAGILLSRLLARYDADVELSIHGSLADARVPESILLLGASQGDAIAVTCTGAQALAALVAVEAYFSSDFLVTGERSP